MLAFVFFKTLTLDRHTCLERKTTFIRFLTYFVLGGVKNVGHTWNLQRGITGSVLTWVNLGHGHVCDK